MVCESARAHRVMGVSRNELTAGRRSGSRSICRVLLIYGRTRVGGQGRTHDRADMVDQQWTCLNEQKFGGLLA